MGGQPYCNFRKDKTLVRYFTNPTSIPIDVRVPTVVRRDCILTRTYCWPLATRTRLHQPQVTRFKVLPVSSDTYFRVLRTRTYVWFYF